MTSARTPLHAARKHLDVFDEAWEPNHLAAMECRDLEEWLAESVMVFELVDLLVQQRRKRVFQGLEEVNSGLDDMEKQLYERWLSIVDREMGRVGSREKAFAAVEGADRLRACRERARALLAVWAPSVPSMAVAHRALDLSEGDAAELQTLLRDPSKGGRLKWEPIPVPPGDPSKLR